MTADSSNAAPSPPSSLSRRVALAALACGAFAAEALMLYVGRRSESRLLLVLFTGWVLGPFAVLLGAHLVSTRWSARMRATLWLLIVIVSVGTAAIYSVVAIAAPQRSAPPFVIVPPASVLIIGAALLASWLAGRTSRVGTSWP